MRKMRKEISALGGVGLGLGLMYFLDPDRGRRRRATVQDKFSKAAHRLRRQMDKAARDLRNRTTGLVTKSQTTIERALTGNGVVDDDVLVERVRSGIGRLLRHPHALEVNARRGIVTLSGDVLVDEVETLLKSVPKMPGVSRLINRIKVHESGEGKPHLQSEGKQAGAARELRQSNWTPALRALAGAGGGALAVYGSGKRGLLGTAAGVAGAAVLTRAVVNRSLGQVIGVDGSPVVEIQKTINILAPVPEVYRFLANFTNLPRFMSHLREVRDLGQGRYHWVADGPAGLPVAWDCEITKLLPDKLVEWKSLPNSAIASQGRVRFDPNWDGGTRLDIRMSYRPPAGMIGHTAASVLGADPKQQMDEDFIRLKSLIEFGRTRAHGKLVTYDPPDIASTVQRKAG